MIWFLVVGWNIESVNLLDKVVNLWIFTIGLTLSVCWPHTSSIWPWSGAPKVRLYDTFLGGLRQAHGVSTWECVDASCWMTRQCQCVSAVSENTQHMRRSWEERWRKIKDIRREFTHLLETDNTTRRKCGWCWLYLVPQATYDKWKNHKASCIVE